MQVRTRVRRRVTVAGVSAALVVAGVGVATTSVSAAHRRAPAPVQLRVGGSVDPIGIDDTTPDFQWQNSTGVADQTAFQVRVRPASTGRGAGPRWQSGRVRSSEQHVEYGGRPLSSRDAGVWQVRVWSGRGGPSRWSEPAYFEMGLLDSQNWTGDWITDPRWAKPLHQDIALGEQRARYVRLTVIDLGRPGEPLDDPEWKPRLELGEVQVSAAKGGDADAGTNLARGATVAVSEENSDPGVWDPQFLVDGKVTSADAPRGYRSDYHEETDVQDRPIVMTIDLGEVRSLDTLRLFPLWDAPSAYGKTPNFPRELTVSVSDDGESFRDVGGRRNFEAISNMHEAPAALPVLARDFAARRGIESARLYVTGLGVYDATINGRPVSDDVLEPANTDHHVRVPYATYDVTDLVRRGRNTWGIALGNGIFNVFNTPDDPDRYMKADAGHGPPRAKGQLEITYRNGRRQIIDTDESWDSALGEVTYVNWYGGEDHDARRSLGAWDTPRASRRGWKNAVAVGPPSEQTELVARESPPIEVVDTLPTAAVTEPKPGVYVFDLGVNFAGWQELTTSGSAGTKITMRPAEKLHADGTVDQRSAGGDIRDTFILSGEGQETFKPRFAYHGFRYLQVEGLTARPTPKTVRGLVLRATNDDVGTFKTSDERMADVHRIIDRSVQSNMYSIFTDCPHREKLGWLDQTNLAFATVASGYDVQAHYRKMLQDVVDAQQDDGMIPTTAPEDSLFAGAFRHDANWGATLAVSSWQLHKWYGDDSAIREYWPDMVEYHDHLAGIADDGILSGGLGDWISPADPSTPPALTQTWAYHRITTHMAWIAEARGDADAARAYEAEAEQIAEAFHEEFYDEDTGLYGNGDQASQALALEENLVPNKIRDEVLDRFVTMIRDADDHVVVGEIGLHATVELLSKERLDEVLYDWLQRNDGPSYGAFLADGATSLPESWTSENASQNHYMLGAIDAWFTSGVAGIAQAPDSTAWEKVVIEPALVGDVTSASASYESVRGRITSSWTREKGRLRLRVQVPANTTAVVRVPVADGSARASRGAEPVSSGVDGFDAFEVGAGDYTFAAPVGAI